MRNAISLIGAVLILTACAGGAASGPPSDSGGLVTVPPNEPLVIAVASTRYSTGLAEIGQDQFRGAELAILDHGAIRGFDLEILWEDAPCSADGGEVAARFLVTDNPNVVAVIGHTCSNSCVSGANIYDEQHFTMISPSCSATSLTQQGLHVDSFLRTIYDDTLEGAAAADYAYRELGVRDVAVMHYDSENTASLVG
ncbi:MAG: ABC transporter substrate-binding protein, partial [Chloroflexi bacterium]|nr:ABC transporter substrate-binding protein [Chloroflexota bacterium]